MDYLRKATSTDSFDVELDLGKVEPLDATGAYVKETKFSYWVFNATNFYINVFDIGGFSIVNKEKAYIDLKDGITIEEALPFFLWNCNYCNVTHASHVSDSRLCSAE